MFSSLLFFEVGVYASEEGGDFWLDFGEEGRLGVVERGFGYYFEVLINY